VKQGNSQGNKVPPQRRGGALWGDTIYQMVDRPNTFTL